MSSDGYTDRKGGINGALFDVDLVGFSALRVSHSASRHAADSEANCGCRWRAGRLRDEFERERADGFKVRNGHVRLRLRRRRRVHRMDGGGREAGLVGHSTRWVSVTVTERHLAAQRRGQAPH